jgi:hypothetical protein
MRLYKAVCAVLEAWADRLHADTLEAEMDNLDWAKTDLDCD